MNQNQRNEQPVRYRPPAYRRRRRRLSASFKILIALIVLSTLAAITALGLYIADFRLLRFSSEEGSTYFIGRTDGRGNPLSGRIISPGAKG